MPDSKRASIQRQEALYGWDPQFELPFVYRSLDHFESMGNLLQHGLDQQIKKLIGRDLKYAFYMSQNDLKKWMDLKLAEAESLQ